MHRRSGGSPGRQQGQKPAGQGQLQEDMHTVVHDNPRQAPGMLGDRQQEAMAQKCPIAHRFRIIPRRSHALQ